MSETDLTKEIVFTPKQLKTSMGKIEDSRKAVLCRDWIWTKKVEHRYGGRDRVTDKENTDIYYEALHYDTDGVERKIEELKQKREELIGSKDSHQVSETDDDKVKIDNPYGVDSNKMERDHGEYTSKSGRRPIGGSQDD